MAIQKRAMMLREVIIHLILIGLIFALFFFATAGRVSRDEVKQQVIEKEVALLIDAAEPGTTISLKKVTANGVINEISIDDKRNIHARVNNFVSLKGYPFFSKNVVSVRSDETKLYIDVR